jgi:hypothetical protein
MTIDIERQPTGTVPSLPALCGAFWEVGRAYRRKATLPEAPSTSPPLNAAWVRLLARLTGLTPAYQMTPTETEALGAEPNEVKRQLVAMTAQLIAATTTD